MHRVNQEQGSTPESYAVGHFLERVPIEVMSIPIVAEERSIVGVDTLNIPEVEIVVIRHLDLLSLILNLAPRHHLRVRWRQRGSMSVCRFVCNMSSGLLLKF